MTSASYTHLTLVVDRSGSMASVREEAEAGINTLVAEQFAMHGELTVTLSQFDDAFDTVQRMSASSFTYELEPRGMTALLDAVGMEIVRTGQDLASLPEVERPGRVLLVVVTDGHENSSHEYSVERVRSMLKVQREQYGWEVRFLGADDAAWQGEALGWALPGTRTPGRATGPCLHRCLGPWPPTAMPPWDRPSRCPTRSPRAERTVTHSPMPPHLAPTCGAVRLGLIDAVTPAETGMRESRGPR